MLTGVTVASSFKVMVGGFSEGSIFVSSREGVNLDGGFGIYREL